MKTETKSREHKIGYVQKKFIDNERGNRVIKTDIYFPINENVNQISDPENSDEKYPAIVFGHAFVMSVKSYSNLVESIVPKGYIFALPKTEKGIYPSHIILANDLVFVTKKLEELNNDSHSVLYKRISHNKCIMGHSMGGGCAILAAQSRSIINGLIALAPYDTNPSAIKAATNVTIPTLIFSGENDCITPPGIHQLPIYRALASDTKTFISVLGGSHCQMAVQNALCNFWEKIVRPHPEITYEQQHKILEKYILPWLDNFMKGIQEAGEQFNKQLHSDPEITFIQRIQ